MRISGIRIFALMGCFLAFHSIGPAKAGTPDLLEAYVEQVQDARSIENLSLIFELEAKGRVKRLEFTNCDGPSYLDTKFNIYVAIQASNEVIGTLHNKELQAQVQKAIDPIGLEQWTPYKSTDFKLWKEKVQSLTHLIQKVAQELRTIATREKAKLQHSKLAGYVELSLAIEPEIFTESLRVELNQLKKEIDDAREELKQLKIVAKEETLKDCTFEEVRESKEELQLSSLQKDRVKISVRNSEKVPQAVVAELAAFVQDKLQSIRSSSTSTQQTFVTVVVSVRPNQQNRFVTDSVMATFNVQGREAIETLSLSNLKNCATPNLDKVLKDIFGVVIGDA